MKEKRVDIYLSQAPFAQILIVAIGGWVATELIDGKAVNFKTYVGWGGLLFAIIVLIRSYVKAKRLSKKYKR